MQKEKTKKSLYLLSLGCSKNLVDSEVMLGALADDYEVKGELSEADLIIINTCGFINSAKSESIQNILDASANRKKDSILVVSGCLSERYQEQLQEEFKNEVDIFTGVGDYDKIATMIEQKKSAFSNKVFLQDTNESTTKPQSRVISNSSYHAYIKISEGCNQSCAFCAIPSFKGRLKSRSIESIVSEVIDLCKSGYFDFSFLAQDSSSFLKDINKQDGLIELIDAIDKIDGVKSARILYLYPSSTNTKLIDAIKASKKFHNYFDMPLQHSSAKVLKSMKREIINKRVQGIIDSFKQDDNSFFRSTFIVGFPNESKQDFKDLCKWVKKSKLDRANVFSYSDEEGTSAYELDKSCKIKQKTIDKRAKKLGKIISKLTRKSLKKQLNTTIKIVLISKSKESDMLLSAKALMWGEDIDGEILINDFDSSFLDKDGNLNVEFGQIYNAYISSIAGESLIAKLMPL